VIRSIVWRGIGVAYAHGIVRTLNGDGMTENLDGLLVIDKPGGITSRAAVDRAQGWFPRGTRIGHTGTLDPLATGVLVLCVGMATRLTEYVQRMPKLYRAGILLGAASDTDDADGVITPTPDALAPPRERIERELSAFAGTIAQVPPAYSAAKVTGRRAYQLARKGQEVSLAPRLITIERIDILDYAYPRLDILVRCGKGTYIRSLARDLGKQLGCGGYIASLRRLEIGAFTERDALSLQATAAEARLRLLPCQDALTDLLPITLSNADAVRLLHGQHIAVPISPAESSGAEMTVFDDAGRLIAIAKVVDGMLISSKVLATS
jgi:tRNA pseudouridine55 synthase